MNNAWAMEESKAMVEGRLADPKFVQQKMAHEMNVQRVQGGGNMNMGMNMNMNMMMMREQMMAQAFMQNQMVQAQMMQMAAREAELKV